MRLLTIFILLTNVVLSFSQEKEFVKGIYEIRYNMNNYESCIYDTIGYRRPTFKECFRNKCLPWGKVTYRKYSICDLDECGEKIVIVHSNDFSSVLSDSLDCLSYSFIVDCQSQECQSFVDSVSGELLKNKIESLKCNSVLFVKDAISYKYSYRAYYFEGEALKFTFDNKDDFKDSHLSYGCISKLCEDNGSIDVYFLFNVNKIEAIDIPKEFIWKRK